MAIYMKYGDIKGSVTDDKYPDTVELNGIEFGTGRGVSMKVGGSSEREATKPAFSELRFSKGLDNSTTAFFQEAVSGKGDKTCTIYFVKTEEDSTNCYLEIELEGSMISSWSLASGGDNPTINMTMAYTKLQQKNMKRDSANASGTPQAAGYDLEAAKSS